MNPPTVVVESIDVYKSKYGRQQACRDHRAAFAVTGEENTAIDHFDASLRHVFAGRPRGPSTRPVNTVILDACVNGPCW